VKDKTISPVPSHHTLKNCMRKEF